VGAAEEVVRAVEYFARGQGHPIAKCISGPVEDDEVMEGRGATASEVTCDMAI